jgi:arylsulfatase A-like enzyme
MIAPQRRDVLYGEIGDGEDLVKTRMIRKGAYKLIYYPYGNVTQLFDIDSDPRETTDLAGDPARAPLVQELQRDLIAELYGGDESWVAHGELVGLPEKPYHPTGNRGLHGQRGVHWP